MAIDRETQVMMDAYSAGIRSPKELANYMAQVTHESNGLNRLEESFRYTRDNSQIPTQSAWREGANRLDAARRDALQGKPERLAELMYGGRNGNDEPGDGWKYHGRGYLPLNGKDNYRAAGEAIGADLVGKPELAADPQTASKVASWYWSHRIPEHAREDVKAATLAINGKYHGLEDRERRFAEWERRLTPEVMQRLEGGAVGRPMETTPAHAASKAPDDQALIDQARKGVHELDRQRGRQPDQFSENLTGSLAAAAKRDGLDRVDHVVLSDDASRAYAVQGNLDSPHKRMAEVQTAQAVNKPFEESMKEMANLAHRQPQAQLEQQQPSQHKPPTGPGM
ncbi:lytic enzyme [Luteibacter aegosomatis]|uniref:XVIPCD domain-containing protein n=1 Tax=Luteibacter aegosomatis TaxID=2911537 RepID=UPI001FFB14CD|nr:XVIPCD domain-containing protein [Luteibacter aegosomatis]UPG84679.1 lytic enzyme [Luteibacter aegosomatis]